MSGWPRAATEARPASPGQGSLDLGTTGHIFPLTWEVNLAGLCDRQVLTSLSFGLPPVLEGLWV